MSIGGPHEVLPPHDTCAFAKRDPDYFDFMMDVLDGVRLVP